MSSAVYLVLVILIIAVILLYCSIIPDENHKDDDDMIRYLEDVKNLGKGNNDDERKT